MVVYRAERKFSWGGAPVTLTPKDFESPCSPGVGRRRVFTRADLVKAVWVSALGWHNSATVTEHVRRLQQRIEVAPARHGYCEPAQGVASRFRADGRSRHFWMDRQWLGSVAPGTTIAASMDDLDTHDVRLMNVQPGWHVTG